MFYTMIVNHPFLFIFCYFLLSPIRTHDCESLDSLMRFDFYSSNLKRNHTHLTQSRFATVKNRFPKLFLNGTYLYPPQTPKAPVNGSYNFSSIVLMKTKCNIVQSSIWITVHTKLLQCFFLRTPRVPISSRKLFHNFPGTF